MHVNIYIYTHYIPENEDGHEPLYVVAVIHYFHLYISVYIGVYRYISVYIGVYV